MSNKKNETLKKVFRLIQSRKIAEIEPDITTYHESHITTYHESLGASMRRKRYSNTICNQQNRPNKSVHRESHNPDKVESDSDNQKEELIDDNSVVVLAERGSHMQDEPRTTDF